MKTVSCRLENDVLVVQNSRICRRYSWNGGNLISREITDKRSGRRWVLRNSAPDCFFPGEPQQAESGELRVEHMPEGPIRGEHLKAEIFFRLGGLEIKREMRIFPDCPAISCDFYARGKAAGAWGAAAGANGTATLERLSLVSPHFRARAVEFFDATDMCNNLVREWEILPYRAAALPMSGNVLFILDILSDAGLFVLKEAPCSSVQLAWPGCDFVIVPEEIRVVGLGLEPSDVEEREWVRCYGVATGVFEGGEFGMLTALREYQHTIRRRLPDRDEMIMLNTWGDRSQDTKISEEFALREIEAGARLGVSHLQLDAGWQTGRDSNSAEPGGSLDNIWLNSGFWRPHPKRFPRGLRPVAEAAKAADIELCLWFVPSKDSSYANWKKDAETLITLNREVGIRVFKIDSVMITDKRADINLRKLLDTVSAACGGDVVFNMDVTAGRRWGYHYGAEYGNRFLENRYTDWSNYYPHYTLRNLWQLSRYVPPQTLQVEFLNVWRNADKYAADDPLAPSRIPFEYAFAVTFMAQPLAWFEAQNLPDQAFEAAVAVKKYRAIQHSLHSGIILPIGEEPTGAAWAGFQSLLASRGYFAVYRQLTERERCGLKIWGVEPGTRIELKSLIGHGNDFSCAVSEDGAIPFALPAPFSYALYEYRLK